MSVKINARELESLLDATPASQNIMLTGKHGIGKSQILEKFFTARGERVVILFLGQMSDPGDLIGLPRLDETTGKTLFMPPYWFPTDGNPVVLFLDELNRARPEVLQTIMDLTLNRMLETMPFPVDISMTKEFLNASIFTNSSPPRRNGCCGRRRRDWIAA